MQPRVQILSIRGRLYSKKDPLPEVTRKLEYALRRHLSALSRKSCTCVRCIQTSEFIELEIAVLVSSKATHVVLLVCGSITATQPWTVVMDGDDGMDDVPLVPLITRIRDAAQHVTLPNETKINIMVVVHASTEDLKREPSLSVDEAQAMSGALIAAGAHVAAVTYGISVLQHDESIDIVLDRVLASQECTGHNRVCLIGDWPKDEKVWRAPSPPAPYEDDEQNDFRNSVQNDREVPLVASNLPSALFSGPTLEVLPSIAAQAPRDVAADSRTVSLTDYEEARIRNVLSGRSLSCFKAGLVTVKSIHVVATKPAPRKMLPLEFWCVYCETVVSGKLNWEQHQKSAPHLKRKEQEVIAVYYCATCHTDICGDANLAQHLDGVKHKKKGDVTDYTCPVCKRCIMGEDEYLAHRKVPCQ